MRGTLFTIAGILLAIWLGSILLHAVVKVLAWGISAAPVIAIVLIVLGLLAGKRNSV
jgi:hypothetical protein